MIIAEGPDGAGKTALVQYLSAKYDIPIAEKVVGEDTKPIEKDLKAWTETNLKKGLQWQLFDRHRLISEPIYGPCMGRSAHPGFDDIQWLTARMIDFTRVRPLIIFCLPPFDSVKSNLTDDPRNIVISAFIEPIYASYVATAAGYVARGQAVLHDYTTDPLYARMSMLFEIWLRSNHTRFKGRV